MRQHPTIDLALSLTPAAWFVVAQTPGDWSLIERLLQPGNVAASTLLVMIVMAFVKGWIVPGWLYQEVKNRADRMEDRAMKATDIARQAVDTAEKTANAVIGTTKDGGK